MLCALIQNNLVVGSPREMTEDEIVSLMPHYQQIIDVTNFNPPPSDGWIFNGRSFDPPPGVDGSPRMIITRLAFRSRFSMQEKAALYTAAASAQGLPIKIYLDDLAAATFINLSRQDTINGIQSLVSIGILTQARANEILRTPPSQEELYRG